ncbi:hypothetical protein [Massilia sp. DD77]|uniref:hypothetical protein n=1 Tax=Massilia sp. DD77 TaxID=3109349 RepID=UPI002FFE5884
MARYIHSSILFQSYVHIDGSFNEIREEIDNLSEGLDSFITDRARHFLYPDIDVDLELKEGSIKTYATVRGTLFDCLPAAYKDFSTEIDKLWWFAKRLSDAAVMEIAFRTGSFLGAIEHTEARPGVIGTTKRIVDGILSIQTVETERAAAQLIKRVRSYRIQTEKILKLVDERDKNLLKAELNNLLKLAPKKATASKVIAKKLEDDYKEALEKFSKVLGD